MTLNHHHVPKPLPRPSSPIPSGRSPPCSAYSVYASVASSHSRPPSPPVPAFCHELIIDVMNDPFDYDNTHADVPGRHSRASKLCPRNYVPQARGSARPTHAAFPVASSHALPRSSSAPTLFRDVTASLEMRNYPAKNLVLPPARGNNQNVLSLDTSRYLVVPSEDVYIEDVKDVETARDAPETDSRSHIRRHSRTVTFRFFILEYHERGLHF
jgi:hypothetical protein